MTTGLTEAITIAAQAHDGQTDKAGQPYILHCLRVMLAMNSDTDRIVAVLHDVLEDATDWQIGDLGDFGPGVEGAVDALTRRDREDYFHYIDRVAANPIAVRVKLADLRDNLDPDRLPNPNAADVLRAQKYRKARAVLQSVATTAAA